MNTVAFAASDVGQRRKQNEDAWLVDHDLGLYAVADGMGGHAKGEVASQLCLETLGTHLRRVDDALAEAAADQDTDRLKALLRGAVHEACRAVWRMAQQRHEHSGMGCTLTAVLCAGHTGVIAHIGDSRLYLARGGRVELMTQDHTYAADALRTGKFAPDDPILERYKHVLSRAVGSQEVVQVDLLAFDLLPEDRLLLCSDGLSEYIPDAAWLAARLGDDEVEVTPDALVAHANASGGKDNITAVVVQVTQDADTIDAMLELRTNVQVRLDAVTSVFLFEDLSLAQVSRVIDICDAEVWEAGQVITREGDPIAHLLMILDGEVELQRAGAQRAVLGAGDHVGATSLGRPRRARAALVATRRTGALRLEREAFRALCQARPWLGIALLERLAMALGDSLDRALVDEADRGGPVEASLL